VREKLARESIKAIIQCGGEGTRMRPLTLTIPKPMLPLGYKPFLEHTINYFKGQGIYNFILTISYLGEQIIKYFEDGSRLGVKIEYSIEKEALGTGGAIKNAEKKINSTFATINGDVLFGNFQFRDILKFHKEKRAIVTIALAKVDDARRFGLVERDEVGKVINFIEKPKYSVSGWVNAGLYVLEPKIFEYIKPRKFVSLEKDVFPVLVEEGKMYAFPHFGYWIDIGVPSDYEKACKDFFTDKIK
jgi:NDP-sugar pyrophosphorylase family protein